ncbi:MAG: tripartite tricarboxylate transporter substrate binding protein [Burkholderiales bacterium]|nr:tripartite tricarboxylate transporter substrate binding protein [Burkholderiales bacterium]
MQLLTTLRSASCALLAATILAAPILAAAQAFPTKPVRVVVPLEPGGAVDIAARNLQPRMQEFLGQPILIENRGGAAGQIGTQAVARAAPDGYTILFTIGGAHVLSMFAYKNLPYHPVKDFTPITSIADTVLAISARASFPAGSVREMIEYARRNPGKVSYGHTGVGGVTHLGMEQIRALSGIDIINVPFKGGGPLTTNLVGGQIDMGVLPLAPVMPHVKAGKVKVLAILGKRRFRGMPDVPAATEQVPGFENLEGTGTWVFGPAGMQPAVVTRLQEAVARAVHSPEIAAKLEAGGQIPNGETPAAMAAEIQSVVEVGARLMKLAGVKPE